MANLNFICPRCNSKHGIDLEDTIQCANCLEELSKTDLIGKTKENILSISEKKEFVKSFIDDNNKSSKS